MFNKIMKNYSSPYAISIFMAFNIASLSLFAITYDKLTPLQNSQLESSKLTTSTPNNDLSVNHEPNNYCIAIRGNGELMPAHWGALAQTIENFGVPKGMAGGSSGSISTFMMESYLMNPLLNESSLDLKIKAAYLAFMIKSMEGFVTSYTDQSKFQHFFDTIKVLVDIDKTGNSLEKRLAEFNQKYPTTNDIYLAYNDIKQLILDMKNSKVFFGAQVERFYKAVIALEQKKELLNNIIESIHSPNKINLIVDNNTDRKLIKTIEAEYTKLKEALTVFGSFNAKDDKALIYRGGIVNFKELAKIFGFIADFYSLSNASPNTINEFKNLLVDCASNTSGLTWTQIEINKGQCKKLLNNSIQSYINDLVAQTPKTDLSKEIQSKRLTDSVGGHLKALVSTSVVVNETSIIQLLENQKAYNLKSRDELQDKIYLESLTQLPITNDDLKFGYWGKQSDLNTIMKYKDSHLKGPKRNPLATMDKSRRFFSLGEASWETVLGLSPAEPGLSSMLPFETDDHRNFISLGGWSDLLPIPVLKFMGCKNVVYVTRQGGESVFAQGIAKRIFGFPEIDWKDLDPSSQLESNKTPYYNNIGRVQESDDDSVFNSQWSQMFNLANPKSNFNLSLNSADAVVCTQWNSFDITRDFRKMIKEAYNAPIYNPSQLQVLGLKPIQDIKWITPSNNILSSKIVPGFKVPQYAGCIPNVM